MAGELLATFEMFEVNFFYLFWVCLSICLFVSFFLSYILSFFLLSLEWFQIYRVSEEARELLAIFDMF